MMGHWAREALQTLPDAEWQCALNFDCFMRSVGMGPVKVLLINLLTITKDSVVSCYHACVTIQVVNFEAVSASPVLMR